MAESHSFLPLCDVLFNIISLTLLFCSSLFNILLTYALYMRGNKGFFIISFITILSSLIICQIISIRWYLKNNKRVEDEITASDDKNQHNKVENKVEQNKELPLSRYLAFVCHIALSGIFWRYAKLFIPVDVKTVKHDLANLCMIRMVQAFSEAVPMLLLNLQLYIAIQNEEVISNLETIGEQILPLVESDPTVLKNQEKAFRDLNAVSAVLSLCTICWALASFSKHARLGSVHRLVLTWLGVIFQFLYHIGMVIGRILSITAYTVIYGYWIFLVILIHWCSMFIWLLFGHANICDTTSKAKKHLIKLLLSFVYIIAYINIQEHNHKQKMTTFYVVIFLENSLLVLLWTIGVWANRPKNWFMVPLVVILSFLFGMFFMFLYYRFFHVRRLGYETGGRLPPLEENAICGKHENMNKKQYSEKCAIPGVFNCRFTNPVIATARKKKKPTSFVPPPSQQMSNSENRALHVPFWRRALPKLQVESTPDNLVGIEPRINIQQKLEEKKKNQLAELKLIEEEIKQGKLNAPTLMLCDVNETRKSTLFQDPTLPNKILRGNDVAVVGTPKQNIPKTYKQCKTKQSLRILENHSDINSPHSTASGSGRSSKMSNVMKSNVHEVRRKIPRSGFVVYKSCLPSKMHPDIKNGNVQSIFSVDALYENKSNEIMNKKRILRMKTQTPEILLTPHIENSCVYTRHSGNQYRPFYSNNHPESLGSEDSEEEKQQMQSQCSDIDSQISLPRSYTLPREFKYNKKLCEKSARNVIMSTNSSDADVDSCDDDDDDYATKYKTPQTITEKTMTSKDLISVPHHIIHNTPSNQMTNLDLLKGHFTSNAVHKLHFLNRGCYTSSKYETQL